MRKLIKNYELYDKYNNIKEVWNARTFDGTIPSKGGLYDPLIFEDEQKSMGFIRIPNRIISPAIFGEFGTISSEFKQVIAMNEKNPKYFIITDGKLELSDDSVGNRGISWLYSVWDDIDLNLYKTDKNKVFIKHLIDVGKHAIFINRIHVSPIVIRPFQIKQGVAIKDSLTELYESILLMNNKNDKSGLSNFLGNVGGITNFYQQIAQKIFDHLFNIYQGKGGIYRTALSGHRVDSTLNLVGGNSPICPINGIVISWHYLIVLCDLLLIGYFMRPENEDKRKALKLGNLMNTKEFGDHVLYIQKNVHEYNAINKDNKSIWIQALSEINDEYEITVKAVRNPAFAEGAFIFRDVIIETEEHSTIVFNGTASAELGYDSDGDMLSAKLIITDEAKKALYHVSVYSRKNWADLIDVTSQKKTIADGALTGLYNATK